MDKMAGQPFARSANGQAVKHDRKNDPITITRASDEALPARSVNFVIFTSALLI